MPIIDNTVAFLLMMLMATVIVLPLSALTIVIVPATKIYMAVSALPTILYTTKLLLEFNTQD